MEQETPEQLTLRKKFENWPESNLRMYAEPNPNAVAFDADKAFARTVLAERQEAKRDARENETLAIARRANKIAISAVIIAAVSIVTTIIIAVFMGAPKP